MKGTGVYSDLIAQRFKVATMRLGLNTDRAGMSTQLFRPPLARDGAPRLEPDDGQIGLFD
jgi:hypothetical protein